MLFLSVEVKHVPLELKLLLGPVRICWFQQLAVTVRPQVSIRLISNFIKVNPFPCAQGESPLHTACRCGLAGLTAELLQQGANPNLQTQKPLPDDTSGVATQTPLHMAIAHNHPDVVSVILEQKGEDSAPVFLTFVCIFTPFF